MSRQVFISYSSKDQDVADAILKALESQGITCWIASRDIPSGVDYAQSILEAIAGSKVIVVLFSSHSNISVHVMREVERAIYYNTPIIPFKIENISPTQSMEYYLATVQWLNATQAPVQNHFNILCDRVRQLTTDTRNSNLARNGKTISAKSIKAFDLAYNAEQKKNLNPSHAVFWLGSRYLPGFDLFEITRKQNFRNRQMVDKALFSEFEKYEGQLGINIGFERFFKSIMKESEHEKEVSLRSTFINNTSSRIKDQHGENISYWWVLGISLSTLWFWINKSVSNITNAGKIAKIKGTLNSINSILQLLNLPNPLRDGFNAIQRDPGESKNLDILKDWIIMWIAQIEMYLLIEEFEISPENAEILLEINPELATFILQKYLKQNPDDIKAIFLIGKSSLKTFNEKLNLEPLFRTDPVNILTWSMKRSIQLNPNSEWSKRARIVLKKINK